VGGLVSGICTASGNGDTGSRCWDANALVAKLSRVGVVASSSAVVGCEGAVVDCVGAVVDCVGAVVDCVGVVVDCVGAVAESIVKGFKLLDGASDGSGR
jgi:hypothetical protein